MKICVSAGKGEGPTPLAAFDAALLDAGVSNYNLICLSSVIPPGSMIERTRYAAAPDEYGHRLYVVMSRQDVQCPGHAAWAGLGWTQEQGSGCGLFVELQGVDEAQVEERIRATLEPMMASRPYAYGSIQCEVAGIACRQEPVCALVIAVYESEGWRK